MRGGKDADRLQPQIFISRSNLAGAADGNIVPTAAVPGLSAVTRARLDLRLENNIFRPPNPTTPQRPFLPTPFGSAWACCGVTIIFCSPAVAAMSVNMRTASTPGKPARHGDQSASKSNKPLSALWNGRHRAVTSASPHASARRVLFSIVVGLSFSASEHCCSVCGPRNF